MNGWRLAPSATWLDRSTVAGGAPYRVLKLSARGVAVVNDVIGQTDAGKLSGTESALIERLAGSGILLRPTPACVAPDDVTVVIPALSSPAPVVKLVAEFPDGVPVVVVDDGSAQPLAPHIDQRALVVRHELPRGPAAARNAGAAMATTTWIAFVDADVTLEGSWLSALLGYVTTDIVALAPRVVSARSVGIAGWFESHAGGLDQGTVPADVAPGHLVSYVPSAVLLVRAKAFADIGGFDETLHVGEDVDLVWRLGALGRIRYEPEVVTTHAARHTFRAALNRRRIYGTSAAALATRHPGALRHVDVSVWSFMPWAVGFANPVLGVLAGVAGIIFAPRGMRTLPSWQARRLARDGHLRAMTSLGRWLIRPLLPVTVAATFVPRLRPGVAAAVAVGLGGAILRAVQNRGVDSGVGSSVAAGLIDDIAYTTGVWQGVVRHRTMGPLLPRVRRRTGRA